MKMQFVVVLLLSVALSGCFDEKTDIVCDAECRSNTSGETEDFPSLNTGMPDSFKTESSSKRQ